MNHFFVCAILNEEYSDEYFFLAGLAFEFRKLEKILVEKIHAFEFRKLAYN